MQVAVLLGSLRRAEGCVREFNLPAVALLRQCVECLETGKVLPHSFRPRGQHPAGSSTCHLPDDELQVRLSEAEGAKALLLEIIRRAAFDWVLYKNSSRPDQRALSQEAYTWLFEEDEEHPNFELRQREGKELTGFISICDLLDMDVDRVRYYIRKLTHAKIMVGRLPRAPRPAPVARMVRQVPADAAADYDSIILHLLDIAGIGEQ